MRKKDDYETKALKLANVSIPNYERIRKRIMISDENRGGDYEQMDPRDRFRTGVFIHTYYSHSLNTTEQKRLLRYSQ